MGEAIGSTLGYAVGIAISPIPIAAVILMLFSGRARVNSLMFMIAWVAGIAMVASVVTLIPGLDTEQGEPTTTTGWVKLVIGVLLLVAGLGRWRTRPRSDTDAVEVPKWMASIDQLKPGAALGLGLLLSALNPKNLLLAAAAGAVIASADLSGGQSAAAIAVFTLLAAISVLVPVIGYLILGPKLDTTLTNAKNWLVANNGAVMAVLLIVFGVSLLGDAIGILTN